MSKVSKALLSSALVFGLGFGVLGSSASATDLPTGEIEGPEVTLVDNSTTGTKGSTKGFSTLASSTSNGTGTVNGSNPLGFKPRATASTSAKSGTAYLLKAKVNSNNNGTSTSTSGWKSLSNTSKVTTSQLVSNTEQTTFHGYHELKKNQSSALETAQTSISF